jgi:hypothetical protein
MNPRSEHSVVRIVEEIEPHALMTELNRRILRFKRAGVAEYWAVDWEERRIHIYRLRNDGSATAMRLRSDWEQTEVEFFRTIREPPMTAPDRTKLICAAALDISH